MSLDGLHHVGYTAPPSRFRVAVVMCAYNAERTIGDAVRSIVDGSYPCKLFIVDDCSAIPVDSVLTGIDGACVEIIRLQHNVGAARARNIALERIASEGFDFIAIMDADDIAHPDRIARQVGYLESNPQIGLVGSWVRLIDDRSGKVIGHSELPCDPQAIRNRLPVRMCMSHPTWMARADVFAAVGHYSPSYRAAEDYELLRRIAARFDVATMPEYLVDYRLSSDGITNRLRRRELLNRVRIQLRHLEVRNWRAWSGIVRTLALLVLPFAVHGPRIDRGQPA